ncbi:hypothetical protein, variant [Fonticula alba]|uniref:Uncharacterized protein n=1 Tax=Fonticula alba TaxID=691883 RepID=A0A058Z246_FONAL|nr:hypothetical protein, variant [Fonticula alba]KCV67968.1 hypothetical protein, variant [Fonticula alba]|eukprot:XP_009497535.1 hypothetical protein, variant [Fonticula alba]
MDPSPGVWSLAIGFSSTPPTSNVTRTPRSFVPSARTKWTPKWAGAAPPVACTRRSAIAGSCAVPVPTGTPRPRGRSPKPPPPPPTNSQCSHSLPPDRLPRAPSGCPNPTSTMPTGHCEPCPVGGCRVCSGEQCLVCEWPLMQVVDAHTGIPSCQQACPSDTIAANGLCLPAVEIIRLDLDWRPVAVDLGHLSPPATILAVASSRMVPTDTGRLMLQAAASAVQAQALLFGAPGQVLALVPGPADASHHVLDVLGFPSSGQVVAMVEVALPPAKNAWPALGLVLCHADGLVLGLVARCRSTSPPAAGGLCPASFETLYTGQLAGCSAMQASSRAVSLQHHGQSEGLLLEFDPTGETLRTVAFANSAAHPAHLARSDPAIGRLLLVDGAGHTRIQPDTLTSEDGRLAGLLEARAGPALPGDHIGLQAVTLPVHPAAGSSDQVFFSYLLPAPDGHLAWRIEHLPEGLLPHGRTVGLPGNTRDLARLPADWFDLNAPERLALRLLVVRLPSTDYPSALVLVSQGGMAAAPLYCHPASGLCWLQPARMLAIPPGTGPGSLEGLTVAPVPGPGAATDGLSLLLLDQSSHLWSLDIALVPCPDGSFPALSACQKCHPACFTCKGAQPNMCTACHADRLLSTAGRCVESCPPGEYNPTGEPVCHACHATCVECSGPAGNNCTACPQPMVLFRDTCVSFCPSPSQLCQPAAECIECAPHCAECLVRPLDAAQTCTDECTSCQEGYLLANAGKLCVAACPSGTFPDWPADHGPVPSCLPCYAGCRGECTGPDPAHCLATGKQVDAAVAVGLGLTLAFLVLGMLAWFVYRHVWLPRRQAGIFGPSYDAKLAEPMSGGAADDMAAAADDRSEPLLKEEIYL